MPRQDQGRSFGIFVVFASVLLVVYGLTRFIYAVGQSDKHSTFVERDKAVKQQIEDGKMMGKILKAVASKDANWPAIHAFLDLLDTPLDGGKPSADKVFAYAETVKKMSKEDRATFLVGPKWVSVQRLADGGELPLLIRLNKAKLLTPALAGEVKPLPAPPAYPKPPVHVPFWDRSNGAWWKVAWFIASVMSVLIWLIWSMSNTAWKSFWVAAAFIIVAPVSFPAAFVYGVVLLISNHHRLFSAVQDASTAVARRIKALLYHLRILRQLPAPVVHPIANLATTEPTRVPVARIVRELEESSGNETIWYVIEEDELLGRRHLLAEKNIDVYPITVQAPRSVKGIGVRAADLVRFEEALGLDAESAENESTDIRQTVLRSYTDTEPELRIIGFPRSKGLLERVLKAAFAHQGLENIVCVADHNWNDATAEVARSASLTIYCLSEYTERFPSSSFGRIFGQTAHSSRLSGVMDREPGQHRAIRDQDGNVLAAVANRRIFLFWFFWENLEEPWVAEALARLLRQSLDAFGQQVPQEEEDREAGQWREGIDKHRERYVQLCMSRIENEIKKLAEDKEACDRRVREAGETITNQLRRRRAIEVRLENYQSGRLEQEKDHLAKEFDQLAASKCVVAVRALDDRVEVDTRTVFIGYEGDTYRIGRFTIILMHDGEVRFSNIDRPMNGPVHPHVRANGVPCLGNITEAVSKLMADRQYAAVTNLLFRYLESYNPSSPYNRIEHWERVKKETK